MSSPPRCRADFYPRPPRGGRHPRHQAVFRRQRISIHALREEGDGGVLSFDGTKSEFLSTPSARRATPWSCGRCRWRGYFYPRPPRGGRHVCGDEHDGRALFLSTPSARRATALYVDQSLLSEISIHALREEGDERICVHSSESGNFYPRPPRGGRPLFAQGLPHHTVISIHALREEGDSLPTPRCTAFADFYPRPPRGGRRHDRQLPPHHQEISIHALREEGDVVL